jgi:hypothetical protein
MKRFKLCWTDKGMERAEAQGYQGVRKLAFSASELTAMTKRMKMAGFEQDEDGWLAPEGMNHEDFIAVIEGNIKVEAKDHSLAESIRELFREADRLQERSETIREQGRVLDQELRRRIEPRVDQWLEGLISSVELLDALEIEKRRL